MKGGCQGLVSGRNPLEMLEAKQVIRTLRLSFLIMSEII